MEYLNLNNCFKKRRYYFLLKKYPTRKRALISSTLLLLLPRLPCHQIFILMIKLSGEKIRHRKSRDLCEIAARRKMFCNLSGMGSSFSSGKGGSVFVCVCALPASQLPLFLFFAAPPRVTKSTSSESGGKKKSFTGS